MNNYLVRETAGVNPMVGFGGTGSLAQADLNTAGTSMSAGSAYFTYRPYCDAFVPASTWARTLAAGTDGDASDAARQRPAQVGARPNPAPLKTLHRQ
ncbi:hypothetical protein [Streptomyces sp. NPDC058295]|uniref:hypothetical protein n=1 Tax=Streptomyces sp. NPDC058295 TaxID=3346431 RepID=UPI0036E043D7